MIREVAVCAMGAFTDKHIRANARMLQAVLLEKALIPSSPFLPPSRDCRYTYYRFHARNPFNFKMI